MKANSHESLHAIILPLPLQGHVNPSVHLALKLASKGFTITFLVFECVHHQILQAQTRSPNKLEPNDIFEVARSGAHSLDIRYRVISDGLPLDFDRTRRLDEYLEWYLHGGMYATLEEEIGKIALRSQPKVNVLIVDTLYPWSSKITKKFGLSFASFWTQPALVFNLFYHVHLLRDHGHFDCLDKRKEPIDYIPGVRQIMPKDLISYLQDSDPSTNMHKLIFTAFQDVRLADYVLCNTEQELELETISALQALIPFYPIGPSLLSESNRSVIPTSLWVESCCTNWLGSRAHNSVLYVSFGSLANFTKDDVLEIAYGLKLSNVDFVWVLRPDTVLHEADDLLPVGFEEEIRDRGIVVPWTNQIGVLSHPAIGGFLTHCGWNSVIESIWCEVPMLCLPVFTDQPTNRKLVVEDWKVGINLCDIKYLKREKIAAQIKSFMGLESRYKLKKDIKEVRRKLEDAFEANGSSEKNIDLFIENLMHRASSCTMNAIGTNN